MTSQAKNLGGVGADLGLNKREDGDVVVVRMKLDSGQELVELDYLLEVEHQVVIQTAHATRREVNEKQQEWSLDEKQATGGQPTGQH